MEQRIVINLGQGSWQQGFSTITVQLWANDNSAPIQFSSELPAAPGLGLLYEQWQTYYRAFNTNLGLRQAQSTSSIEIEDDDITHISGDAFESLCQKLKQQFNAWLDVSSFISVEGQLRTYLESSGQIQLIVEVDDSAVRRFPWHLWDFLEDYRQVEIAIGTLGHRGYERKNNKVRPQVRVLSVLGDATGIEVSKDRDLLQALPDVKPVVLDEPSRSELDARLWDEQGWDVLFFAGHSTSVTGDISGRMKINAEESLSIAQLKYGLQSAIGKGLQLAIFNSCDGMGLARELAELHIPYLIVMREPVPDKVAQAFLMNFLRAFATGIPFHEAMREARERLQGLESQFPCASWLPVLCQTPGLEPLTWQALKSPRRQGKGFNLQQRLLASFSVSAIAALLMLMIRAVGLMEAYELTAYDQFMNLQPQASSPERILIVEATQEDVNTYGSRIPNDILAKVIETIEDKNPRVIGLDIFRNREAPNQAVPYAPNEDALYDQFLSQDNLVSICSVITNSPGVPPPPNLPATQLGFSNVLEDSSDQVVRRQLLFMTPDPDDPCKTEFSLSAITALHYLDKEGIQPETVGEQMHLGKAVFTPLEENSGAYYNMDSRGFQVLLNYGDVEQFAQRISLSEVLEGQLKIESLEDYGVLIGMADPFSTDYLLTPKSGSVRPRQPTHGVILHAQMLNHLLSAALDGRRVINVLPGWVDAGWIVVWSLLGAGIGWVSQRASLWGLALGGAVIALYGVCLGVFILGWWVPWVPAVIALVLSSSGIWMVRKRRRSQ